MLDINSVFDRHVGLKAEGKGVLSLGFSGRAFQRSAATLGLATQLDAQRCNFEKTQPGSIERSRSASLELQLDLVDRLCALTFDGTDLAFIDRSYDLGRGVRFEGARCTLHYGGEPCLKLGL